MFQENTNTTPPIVENAAEIPNVAVQSIDGVVESIVTYSPTIFTGISVLLIFWLVGRIVRVIFLKMSQKANLDSRLRILVSRLLVVTIFVLGVFTALTVVIPKFSFGDLIAGLGFTSFIIGFATKDILNNFLSGVLVLWQEPFKIGDYLFVNANQGAVEHIGVRATRLRMDDGERILIPNGEMYSSALTIREAGTKRRMKLDISTNYSADIGKTKSIISGVLQKVKGVDNEPKPNVFVTDLASDGVNLSIYFWINTEENSPLGVFDDVATTIKESLNRSGITLYPPTVALLKDEKVRGE